MSSHGKYDMFKNQDTLFMKNHINRYNILYYKYVYNDLLQRRTRFITIYYIPIESVKTVGYL